jgi:hypothetical protein
MKMKNLWYVLVEVSIAMFLMNYWGVKSYTVGWWIGFILIDVILVSCRIFRGKND